MQSCARSVHDLPLECTRSTECAQGYIGQNTMLYMLLLFFQFSFRKGNHCTAIAVNKVQNNDQKSSMLRNS